MHCCGEVLPTAERSLSPQKADAFALGRKVAPTLEQKTGPLRRLAAGEVPADAVRAHLGQVVEALQEGTPTPVAGVADRS
jgi:hypothetical protein